MRTVLFRNARLLDGESSAYRPGVDILVEGNRIREIGERRIKLSGARVIDLRGRVLMPGLIDAHVHVIGVTADLRALARIPAYLVAAQAKGILEAMLMRGFTTVRDAGGADWGLAEAVRRGHFIGPRLLVSGLAIAQTGGQGDFRARGETEFGCPVCRGNRSITRLADGVDAVRLAVREELRGGADQIKIMASGGLASGVPLERPHFSDDELRAMVEEASAGGTYVMAHAYESAAIQRCIDAGVRSIEHGTLLDSPTARRMAQRGTFMVPTLSVLERLSKGGRALGLPQERISYVGGVLRQSLVGLDAARSAGVRIGHGSDLEGEMHGFQSGEFLLKARVMPPHEVIASATRVNAELLRLDGEIGTIAVAKRADILVIDGDPLRSVGVLARPDLHLRLIMKDGTIYKDDL